jgi:peptidyl-prolyl cis-trans isomerase D
MLNAMRRHANGVVMKVFLSLIVLSFVVWGIGDLFRGRSANTVAAVGDTNITIDTFRETFNRAVQRAGSQVGRPISTTDARAIGLDRRVLGELMGEATLNENARQLGLGVPDSVVAGEITKDPNFLGPNGQFDLDRFNQILRSNGLTEAFYVGEQRRLLERRQIIDSIAGGMTAPQALIEAVFRHQSERRSASYLIIPAPAANTIAAPDDAALQTFFDERKGTFQAPERRSLSVLSLTPQSLAAKETVSDEDLRARYEQDRASFGTPERRTVERIPFPSVKEARAAAAQIASGTPFEQVATAHNVAASDVAMGTVTKDAIIDKAIADAAFALPQGQVSAPVEGQFSNVLLRVTAIEPATVKGFDEVREQLRTTISTERGQAKLLQVHDQVEDSRAGGATLAETAGKLGLSLAAFEAVDRQGNTAEGASAGVPGGPAVLEAAFSSDVGVENDPVQVEGQGYVWYDVTKVDPARARTFDEARADVLTRWQTEEARKALDAKVEQAMTGLRADTLKLPDLAAREGVEVLNAQGIDRRGGDPALGQAGTAQVFSTPRGSFGTAPAQTDTGRIIFQVTTVDTPPFDPANPGVAQLQTRLADTIENDLASQYALRLQSDLGATVHNQALATALGGPTEN